MLKLVLWTALATCMEQPNRSLPPAVVTPKDTQAPPFKRRKCFRCPCSISYCQSGEIRNILEAAGLNNLLGARRVEYAEATASHQQRKLYAFTKCVEFHLKISDKVFWCYNQWGRTQKSSVCSHPSFLQYLLKVTIQLEYPYRRRSFRLALQAQIFPP